MTSDELAALPWQPVKSSNIEKAAYVGSPTQGTLYLAFRRPDADSIVYRYEKVERWRYDRIVTAASPGSMRHKLLKGVSYSSVEVDDTTDDGDTVVDRLEMLEARVRSLEATVANLTKGMEALSKLKLTASDE